MRRFEDWSRSLMSREPLRVLLLATDRAACLPVELRDELQSVFEDSNFALPKCNRILPFWTSEIRNVAREFFRFDATCYWSLMRTYFISRASFFGPIPSTLPRSSTVT